MFPSFSWLPSLPSIDFALPASIQKRFISFALRQSLGHFLKPGQLDTQQVDSQIGSGYVQVRDLELNNEAINALISTLPIRLHDGSVGKATARIPWPNPLTASVGLSLESLHLTFYMEPHVVHKSERPFVDNLAESVVSVAETFIHEELTPNEEATLRESIHPEFSAPSSPRQENLPGGLDPFLSEEEVHFHDADPPGVSIVATLIERLLARFQFDAADIRITIVNPQDASFTLIVPEIRYGTESQQNAAASSPLPDVPTGEVRKVTISGVTLTTRCLRPMSPQPLTSSSLVSTPKTMSPVAPRSVVDSPLTASHASVHSLVASVPAVELEPSSPYSDSSSLDEDTQLYMSQSIAMLPPRPVSPTSSVASSMYQSAISTAGGDVALDEIPEESASVTFDEAVPSDTSSDLPEPVTHREPEVPAVEEPVPLDPPEPVLGISQPSPRPEVKRLDPPTCSPLRRPSAIRTVDIEDETILSLGSEPIELRLTTPPPSRSTQVPRPATSTTTTSQDQTHPTEPPIARGRPKSEDKVCVDLSIGLVACALTARQIRSIIDLAELWTSHSFPVAVVPEPVQQRGGNGSPFPFDNVDGSIRIRGLVVLLLPRFRTSASNPDDALTEYFARPLVPPRLPRGFGRMHLEALSSTVSLKNGQQGKVAGTSRHGPPSISASLTIAEISAFAFLPGPAPNDEMTASPILITDPHLPVQYPVPHVHPTLDSSNGSDPLLPTFDVIDWTDATRRGTSAKLSAWRTKPCQPSTHPRPPSQFASEARVSTSPTSSPRSLMDAGKPSSMPSSRPIVLPSSPGKIGLAGLSTSPGEGSRAPLKPPSPALSVRFVSAASRGGKAEVDVSLAPLHVFLDTGMMLSPGTRTKSETLQFIDELTISRSSDLAEHPAEVPTGDVGEDEDSRPSTPRPDDREAERERERRRLEQLVLEDLDLGYDYRDHKRGGSQATPTRRSKRKAKQKPEGAAIKVKLPALRVEIRVAPPPNKASRSGAVVFDIHDVRLYPGIAPPQDVSPTARFGSAEEAYDVDPARQRTSSRDNILLGASWKRIVVSCALHGESKAQPILSLGSLGSQDSEPGAHFGVGTPPARETAGQSPRPQLVVRSTSNGIQSPTNASPTSTTVTIDLPSIYVELSKPIVDGLQLWADDLTQLMDRAFSEPGVSDSPSKAGSGDSSLIGSRYFARSSTVGSSTESGATSLANTMRPKQESRGETAVKIAVTEVALRTLTPRGETGCSVRPFDVTVSDVDVLLELKPEGKDETVVTVGVMDLNIHDITPSGSKCYLSLTNSRSLATSARSALKLRFTSLVVPGTAAKESRVRLTVSGITYNFYPDIEWTTDLARFFKAPPGAFESVVPSERTRVNVKIHDTSIRLFAPVHKGALLPYIGELEFSTVIEGNSPNLALNLSVPMFSLLFLDDATGASEEPSTPRRSVISGIPFWQESGYALVTEINDLVLAFKQDASLQPPDNRLFVDRGNVGIHMCADTMGALGAFAGDLSSAFKAPNPEPIQPKPKPEPSKVTQARPPARGLLSSLDESAFRRLPEVGAAPDMIDDDLPTNPDYLDESFGAAAGLRELSDDEFTESDLESSFVETGGQTAQGATSAFGGETIRMLVPEGLHVVENYFETLPPDPGEAASFGDTTFQARIRDFNATLHLYDGYDWVRTRKIIEERAKEMRRKLAKIRQLVASGQTPDPSVEETSTLLFNSVYIGLEHNVDELEPGALIAAIDEELNEEFETNTQSSWQSLKPQPLASPGQSSQASRSQRRRLRRSKGSSIEIKLMSLAAEFDQYRPEAAFVSRVFATIRDLEILDHIKTSTWKKFLTSLRADSRGNVRETDSHMVRVELRMLHPVPGHPSEEARLRAKILPLRLHVDQDALDFLKQFFAFKDPDAAPLTDSEPSPEIYFQQAEVFPVDIKLDYKPRRVDYRALREGRTIELMNFFHFDGAEMTLRHITLKGITGWPRFFDLLNDLWTPDVKATQLVDVISGVAPIRSVVNVGSGVADLVLLPIAQYKKDGRVVRGLQKGTNAFMKSTAMEAIRLGARLATGTQVILEHAETVLGGQFQDQITAEAVQVPTAFDNDNEELDGDTRELISKYAEQPVNVKEGVQFAYKSLKRNLNSAAQTILAVPMEVYERSGNEGAVRAVVRAVPIAVLKPMIGATEAVSKTLLGLQNTLDPGIRQENEAKYKQR